MSLLCKMSWKQIYASNFFIVNVIRCARTRRSSGRLSAGRLSAGLSVMSRLMKIPNMRRYFTDPFGRKGFCVCLRVRKWASLLHLRLGVKGDSHPSKFSCNHKGMSLQFVSNLSCTLGLGDTGNFYCEYCHV